MIPYGQRSSEEIIVAWQTSVSTRDALEHLHLEDTKETRRWLTARVYRMRKSGIPLKKRNGGDETKRLARLAKDMLYGVE